MRRAPLAYLALVVAGLLAGSCLGSDDPTGVAGGWNADLPISPSVVESPANAGAQPINRVRAVAVQVTDSTMVGETTVDVSPTDAQWTLSLSARLTSTPVDVTVFLYLLHVEGDVESVEYSGMVGPLTLTRGSGPVQAPDISLVRGPVANLYATGVAITSAPDTLTVGDASALEATATTSGATPPEVFWTVLDSAVLSVSGSVVTAVAPGAGRVVASAGAFADTAAIVVQPATSAPTHVDLEVLKTVDDAQPLEGSAVAFTVSVTNHGPITATDVAVFDTLAAVFTSPAHELSTGTLVGDSLWTVPRLDAGQTATWTTTATVATGAAGGSATNTAVLRSLAQSDTTPGNDAATVSVSFPLSAVPVVQITAPADSAVFDPGQAITFTGTATDAEDGDLSASIVWSSSADGALGTGPSLTLSSLSAGAHTISAEVVDSDNGVGADSIQITVALYTVPATLNVPFGGTASLPISLSEPAPPGGVTLSVVSGDPSVTAPSSGTVSIAAGALSANATLAGLSPGTTDVTVSNPQFGVAVSTVSVTAALNITSSSVSFASPFTQTVPVRLESQGTPIAAPAGGLPVTLTSSDATCVANPSPVTIPAGQVSATATLAYGGSATTPCQARVYATATGVDTDSVAVTVTPAPTLGLAAVTVGSGLQTSTYVSLGVSNHGGVTVHVASTDPATALVSPDASTPGTASIDLSVPDGTSTVNYYVQGLENTSGNVTLTASAPSFLDGQGTVAVQPAGVAIAGLGASTTTLSPDDPFYAIVGYPYFTGVYSQNVRAGGSPVTVTFTTGDSTVAALATSGQTAAKVTATIPVGASTSPTTVAAGGVALDPLAAGQTTVVASASGYVTEQDGAVAVTVSPPGITVNPTTVASDLQAAASVSLGASNHGGVTVHIASADAQVLLVSPDATTAGAASIDVQVPDGATSVQYYVQGVEGATGDVTVTASAPGFVDGSGVISVKQLAISIGALSANLTTLTPDDPFYAVVGYPYGTSVWSLSVRAGGTPINVYFTSSDSTVADFVTADLIAGTATATIPVGSPYTPTTVVNGGVALHPLAAGATKVTAVADGAATQPAGSVDVTVTAPSFSLSAPTVASGLQTSASVSLGASGHGGVTVHLASADPNTLLVSPDASTAGTSSIDVFVPDGSSSFSYYVQGFEGATGDIDVTASAPGFTDGSSTISVAQAAIAIGALGSSPTTLSPDDPFYAVVGYPYGNSVWSQNVRAGSPGVAVTFTSSAPSVATLVTSDLIAGTVGASIPAGQSTTPNTVAGGGVALDLQTAGQTTVSVAASGFVTQPAGSVPVTVSAPQIVLAGATVGSDLQTSVSGNLGATNHGGVTVHVQSLDPSTLLVSPSASTAGTGSIDIPVADGNASFTYYVQGVEGATGDVSVTASAPGFIDGSATVSVVQPGVAIGALAASTTAGAANDEFYVSVGYPYGTSVWTQVVRAGGTPITVTLTSSDPAVATLVTADQTAGSVTTTVDVGSASSPGTVAGGGAALDPLTAGQTSVSASAPGLQTQPAGTVAVTVNP